MKKKPITRKPLRNSKLTRLQKEIADTCALMGMTATFGTTFVNIANPHGIHAEFYGTEFERFGDGYMCVSATYSLTKGKPPQDLDFELPDEICSFVSTVKCILQSRPGRWLK